MRVCIVGGGKVGYYLAKTLLEHGHTPVLIEDDPAMLDRLMDLGLPVLVRRHAYNTAQCERAEQSGLGLAFDDWTQVPGLAERLIGGSH